MFDCDCRANRPGTEEIVAAGVSRDLAIDREPRWNGVLIDARQSVKLGQYCDDRSAISVRRNERSWNRSNARFDCEPFSAQRFLQQRRTAGFLVTHFGVFPDRTCQLGRVLITSVNKIQNGIIALSDSLAERQQ